jgi:hypothetical protein
VGSNPVRKWAKGNQLDGRAGGNRRCLQYPQPGAKAGKNKENNKMKYLKMLGLAAVAAMALMAIGAGSASATTLEVGGVTKNASVTVAASVSGGAVLAKTDGTEANTCSESSVHGSTVSPFSATKVTGSLTTLSFKKCTNESVVVDAAGGLLVEYESGTSGNVYSENAKVTVPTSFGFSVTCDTGSGTKIGTLDGVASGTAKMTISAVLNCGFLLPSATWKGTYTVSSALGVVA